eukprot:Colp12_sorted_trinity150504_noHs@3132
MSDTEERERHVSDEDVEESKNQQKEVDDLFSDEDSAPAKGTSSKRVVSDDEDAGSDKGEDDEEYDVAKREALLKDVFGSDEEEDDEAEFKGFDQETVQQHVRAEKEKSKKKRRRDDDDDEGSSKRSKERRASSGSEDEGERNRSAAIGSKGRSDFEQMLEDLKQKRKGRRKKGKNGEEDLNTAVDEKVKDLINEMDRAAEDDRTANQMKKPAFRKLKLLDRALMEIRKADLQQVFLENDVLVTLRKWLEPLPDKSLPNLKIRQELLNLFKKLQVDSEMLRDSGLGRVLVLLSKHPNETPDNRLTAKKLVEEWARPLFQLESSWREVSREEREEIDKQNFARFAQQRKRSSDETPKRDQLDLLKESERQPKFGEPGFRIRAAVALPSNKDYVVRPESQVDSKLMEKKAKGMTKAELLRKLDRKSKTGGFF